MNNDLGKTADQALPLAKARWPRLTEEDWTSVGRTRETLIQTIEKRYGLLHAEAERQLAEFERENGQFESAEGQGFNDARGEIDDKAPAAKNNGLNMNNDPVRLREKSKDR